MSSIELLSPAGSYDCVLAAAHYGADAVYMGGPVLQMRASSVGFSEQDVCRSLNYLHSADKKGYITVNTVLFERDIPLLTDYIDILKQAKPDGLIVSDLGAIVTIRKNWPDIPIILSTQANVMNSASANHYYDIGVTRIVLAREMSISDIQRLRENTDPDLQLEAFVHGSMCMAYSGRCLLSSFLLGRSANAGKCAQPCRWEYRVEEKKRPGQFFDVEQYDDYSLIFSSRDLCMIEHLSDLIHAGVTSFKIEGRMKTEYYTAAVTNAYRMALDGTAPLPVCRSELDKVSHRPYTSGFYYNELPDDHYNDGLYIQDWTFCGKVLAVDNGIIFVQQRNHFAIGDEVELLSPGKAGLPFTITEMQNSDGETIDCAPHPLMTVKIPCTLPCRPGDMLRKKIN